MSWLRQLTIGRRLGAAFLFVLALLCAVAALGAWQLRAVNGQARELGDNWLPSVQALGELRGIANAARRSSLQHVLEDSAEQKRVQRERHDQVVGKDWPAAMARYEPLVSSDEERQLLVQVQRDWKAYGEADQLLLAASDEGEPGMVAARALAIGDTAHRFDAVAQHLTKGVELNARGAADARDTAQTTFERSLAVLAALAAVALAAGSALAWSITRSITGPLDEAVALAETVARGDLRSRVVASGRDEAARLLEALGRMNARLAEIVGRMRQGSDSIATGSSQIATGNADLSQRTEEQASSLEETAASMEQLSGTVRHNAETAQQARELADAATRAAEHNGETSAQVVRTMDEISGSSRRIAEIIGVIDGIAFQTNILALNAAVEAARAGEQGRGFAVVASEVRTLAQRSADAAKEIRGLIQRSVEQVEGGARLVQASGQDMQALVGQVRQVGQLIQEIAGSTAEQSRGISQVSEAVSQLDHVTQQNAALVEQSAAAAESLKHQAALMAGTVAEFRLADGATGAGPAALSVPSPSPAPTPRPVKAPAPVAPRPAPAATAPAGGDDDWTSF
jgi:methyl-accepting chemotaxis protein